MTRKPIEIDRLAVAEAREAKKRYREIRESLAERFNDEFDAAIERIAENPLYYAADAAEYRTCRMGRLSYALIYKDFPEKIWIAAVSHLHRRPGYYKRRRPNADP